MKWYSPQRSLISLQSAMANSYSALASSIKAAEAVGEIAAVESFAQLVPDLRSMASACS